MIRGESAWQTGGGTQKDTHIEASYSLIIVGKRKWV